MVDMTAMWGILPEMVFPDLPIELDTKTAMNEGTLSGGAELAPGSEVHVPPQVGGVVLGVRAKPLKLSGAAPPLRELRLAHSAPQNVTAFPLTLLLSPMTKPPLARKAKMVVATLVLDGR